MMTDLFVMKTTSRVPHLPSGDTQLVSRQTFSLFHDINHEPDHFAIATNNRHVVNIWDCVYTRRDRDINICVLGREQGEYREAHLGSGA